MDDEGTALKDLELPEEEVTIVIKYDKIYLLNCSTQLAPVKSTDKPTEQKSTKQWAIQVDLGDHALDEFHSRIPCMAHKVCLDNQLFNLYLGIFYVPSWLYIHIVSTHVVSDPPRVFGLFQVLYWPGAILW